MRLRLELPPNAIEHAAASGGFAVELAGEPWLCIEIGPLVVAPLDPAPWLRALLEPRSPERLARVLGSTRGTTGRGWPLETIHVVELDADRSVEHRLVTTYDLFGHVAAVTACSADGRQSADALQPLLLPLFASAWPDWRTRTPIAIAELWSLERTR